MLQILDFYKGLFSDGLQKKFAISFSENEGGGGGGGRRPFGIFLKIQPIW